MSAIINERVLSLVLMIFITATVLVYPIFTIIRAKIKLRANIIFIIFWCQAWGYLCLIPTINCLLPDGKFAFPEHLAHLRMIQFTNDQVFIYAMLQLLIMLLFFFPMSIVYKKKLFPPTSNDVSTDYRSTSFSSLIVIASLYTIFGLLYFYVIYRTGLYTGQGITAELFLSMNQIDRFIWKIYRISSPIFLVVIILAYCERGWSSIFKSAALFIITLPGLVINFISFFISSRTASILLILSIMIILFARGHIKIISKKAFIFSMIILIFLMYSISVIPNLRNTILRQQISKDKILTSFLPFKDSQKKVDLDIGPRFDGLELMVLAVPDLKEKGFVPLSWYLISLYSPILPLFPALEKDLKIDQDIADFKKLYLKNYTPAINDDYMAVSLTELFMLIGPLGFVVAGIFFGFALRLITDMLIFNSRYAILGIFIFFCIFIFELPFATILTGWIKILPVILLLLLFNPWRKKVCCE